MSLGCPCNLWFAAFIPLCDMLNQYHIWVSDSGPLIPQIQSSDRRTRSPLLAGPRHLTLTKYIVLSVVSWVPLSKTKSYHFFLHKPYHMIIFVFPIPKFTVSFGHCPWDHLGENSLSDRYYHEVGVKERVAGHGRKKNLDKNVHWGYYLSMR